MGGSSREKGESRSRKTNVYHNPMGGRPTGRPRRRGRDQAEENLKKLPVKTGRPKQGTEKTGAFFVGCGVMRKSNNAVYVGLPTIWRAREWDKCNYTETRLLDDKTVYDKAQRLSIHEYHKQYVFLLQKTDRAYTEIIKSYTRWYYTGSRIHW